MYSLITKAADEIVLTEGTLVPFIFMVKSGKLRAFKTHGRLTQIVVELGPGDFIGEMAHLGTSKTHSASVIAVTDSELVQIDADKIFEVLGANPVWLKAMMQNLVKKIEAGNKKNDLLKKAF